MKQSRVIDILILILLITNLIYQLNPLITGELPTAMNITQAEYKEQYQLQIAAFNSIIFFLIIIFAYKSFKFDHVFFAVLLLEASFFISISVDGFNHVGYAFITNPLSYIAVFCLLFKYCLDRNIASFIFIVLLIWSIIPVVFIFIDPFGIRNLFYSGDGYHVISTFKGFAYHRNVYGFYAGIAVISLFFVDMKPVGKLILYFILLFGIVASESRIAILAAIFLPAFFLYKKYNKSLLTKIAICLISSTVFISIFYFLAMFSTRGLENLTEFASRNAIISEFIDIFLDNLFFGIGGSAINQDENPVHNFVIQVLANYGIFTGILFLTFVCLIWKKGSLYFKILWTYLLLFGLFQPYFQFGPIGNMSLILIITAISFNSKENMSISWFPNIKN